MVPSVLGGVFGGFFMRLFYEPLLLFIKYRDLTDQDFEELDEKGSTEDKKEEVA